MNSEATLMERFVRIGELLHRRHHARRRHGPAGDPLRGQGRVMALLKMRPEISQKDLSYLLDIRPQSLGELLAKLERSGFIERTQSETDKRVVDIRLTEAGAAAAETSETPDDEPFATLSDGEKNVLANLLDRIIADLEAGREENDGRGEDECRRHGHGHGRHHRHHHGHHHDPHDGLRPHHGHGRGGRHDGHDVDGE